LISDDDGQSWLRSNLIDLGGHGHHDGATEPTVVELSDGRLMMLIRTNLGFFWQAFSDDGGRYWRTIQPTPIDTSSAPGRLVRLQSGRLVLVWNRRNPSDGAWPLVNPSDQHNEFPSSWHREELSISVSEEDGRYWSNPIVIARLRGGQLSYPYVLERRAGELWVIAGFAARKWFNEDPVALRVKLDEAALVREIG
jgi:predicted neuraminidase